MEKLLIINSGENLEDKLFLVQKKTQLTLKPGPKCQALNVTLKTNYPLAKNSKFNRQEYTPLPVQADHQDLISSSFNWHVSLNLDLAGTFHFVCNSLDEHNFEQVIWQAYVIVKPEIKLPLNSIRCQTVLSKNLGPFSEWRKRLAITREAKYNMIHLTPIQELGSSNSAYALRNQHKVNPLFQASLDDIKKEIDYMEKKLNILTVTDIVLNHTADDSEWIRERPECAYNLRYSPHLRPAFLLDSAFIWLAQDIIAQRLTRTMDLSIEMANLKDIQTIGVMLKTFYVPQLKIYELFMINIGKALNQFDKLPRGSQLIVDYGLYERNNARVLQVPDNVISLKEFRQLLLDENLRKKNELKGILDYAINNAMDAMRYERLDPKGPYYHKSLDPTRPLVAPYFTHTPYDKFQIAQEEQLMYKEGQQFMAHNGWVMGSTSFEDFASKNSSVYLKRELIAWGDCIKLNYGSSIDEIPKFLLNHMKKYVESQAKVFHGFRIDNCHSTPLHVAELMLDFARLIRPDIYIMAELFTSCESVDNIYINKLGLTSLIRESMSAHNSQELGRLIYRFGGTPVGAFQQPEGSAEPLKPQTAAAIFYDQTHDNQSPIQTKSAYDLTATSSLINMANCATGSNRGYDELVPHHINVVHENRLYNMLESPTEIEQLGIVALRKMLNGQLHRELLKNFSEIFVDQVNEDVIAITRHNPLDGRSIVLIARTAFSKDLAKACYIPPIPIQGRISKILFEAQAYGNPDKFEPSQDYINGLTSFKVKIFQSNVADLSDCKLAKLVNFMDQDRAELQFNEFQFLPSSVLAVEICLSDRQSKAVEYLNNWSIDLLGDGRFNDLSLNDANYILYRCSQEDSFEPYELPDFCKFTYNGLYGLMYYLDKVRENQDQAHPLANNLRQGNWLSEYIVRRLRMLPNLVPLADYLNEPLTKLELLPRGMIPKYFDLIINKFYRNLLQLIYSRMSIFVSKGPELVKLLALSSVALVGECHSAPLPTVTDIGTSSKLNLLQLLNQPQPSLAAGLPHFASGYMRNWGRDTFIALRGLLLITGRFNEAKNIILSYGRCLKNGLIPNLLDGGVNARYNCRDAVWWWLYSIKEYTRLAPNGTEILRAKVRRLHKPEPPANGTPMRKRSVISQMVNGFGSLSNGYSGVQSNTSNISGSPDLSCSAGIIQPLSDIIQETMECHFKGMKFVEENAGKKLDEHMLEQGFEVEYGVKRDTGFVFGGNQYNCGTWMDKMGSSVKAGTKGKPASPRDGSAIELIGLCKAVVSWLDEMFKNNRAYPFDGVECLYDNTITLKWTWKKWATMIQSNFERHFYVPLENEPAIMDDPHPNLINCRGIYKDTVNATTTWQDYQLRPNFLITMVVAPELFDKEHAKNAIRMAKERLCGPLGMKTLDPSDWNYVGDYDNGDDSENPKVAHGFNYHQGPEWLWLTGYYIRASSKFLGASERAHHLKLLSNFYATLVGTPWLGLPELTNVNGSLCRDSCPIQAWSLGTALEALHESVRSS